MQMPESVPCLLFVAADEVFGDAEGLENVSAEPQVKGYALVLGAFENNHQQIIEEFSRNNIQVISGGNFEVPPEMAAKEFIMFDGALWSHLLERKPVPNSPPAFVHIWRKSKETVTFADARPATGIRILHVYEYHELLSVETNLLDPGTVSIKDTKHVPEYSEENLKAIEQLLLQTRNIKYGLFRQPLVNFAVIKNQIGLLKLLLKHGIGLPDKVSGWSSVLEKAADKLYPSYITLLLKHLSLIKSDNTGGIPLFKLVCTAVFNMMTKEICKVLLQLGPGASTVPLTSDNVDRLLRAAVIQDLPDVLQLILGFGPVVTDLFNLTSFDLSKSTCRELMENYGFKSDVVEDLSPVLCDAILNNQVEVVKNLLGTDNVNKVFKYDDTWFQRGCTNKLRKLLRPKMSRYDCSIIDVGMYAYRGYFTPLHMAAACGEEAMIKLLLELGADVNAEVEKRTPIYDAILTDNWDAVKLLIANGANVRNKPELVDFAVERGRSDIVELLLLNLSVEDSELQRLLGIAALDSCMETMECLFKFGAKVDAGFTTDSPEGIGGSRRFADVMQVLLDHGFKVLDYLAAVRISFILNNQDDDFYAPAIRHYMKLKSAKLLSDEGKVPALVDFYPVLSGFQNKCDAEVAKLKSERIGNTNETFFDVLTASVTKLTRFARHADFKEIIRTENYKNQFPIYAGVLKCQFEKGAHRRQLLDRGIEICGLLSQKFKKFPDLVKEEIMKHLSNYNLKVLNYEFEQYAASADEK